MRLVAIEIKLLAMNHAFLTHEDLLFYSSASEETYSPHSAVVNLIQGIYEHSPTYAREILRNRVFTTKPLTEMCSGIIKVAAKRHGLGAFAKTEKSVDVTSLALNSSPHFSTELEAASTWEEVTRSLHSKTSSNEAVPLHMRDRNVSAILVSPENAILGWSKNTNSVNRTKHAEVNLVQGWWNKHKKPIPRGAKIFTTLQCCKMCAGMIWECAEDPKSLEIFYLEKDSGPNARNRVWDRLAPQIESQITQ